MRVARSIPAALHAAAVQAAALAAGVLASSPLVAEAADLTVGALGPNQKVRPDDAPGLAPSIRIEAGRNEFEGFQVVLRGGATATSGVSVAWKTPLASPTATFPAANVTLYAERLYEVKVASNDEGGAGAWPDPLVPDVDTYFGEKRNAFPLDVPAGKSRAVWVDVLVPSAQAPGDYTGVLEVTAGGASVGTVSVTLHVGTFTLPSTSTLASLFGMGWNAAPVAHCGTGPFPFCGDTTGETSNALRALYVRAALEHRFTIGDTDFQPPFGSDQALYEKHVLPMVLGTSAARLPGARLTAVRLDGSDTEVGKWIAYAKSKGFADRLLYYPTDEPGSDATAWANFVKHANALHAADASARILITATLDDATKYGAKDVVDLFVPVLDEIDGRPGTTYAGDQRSKYDAWLAAKATRGIWGYQSCDQHGCGACHETSPGVYFTGWPNRVIDSSAVQDRAFPWQAFRYRLAGELYFETTYQLATAWDPDGQCAFSGSGDGTLFYPGTPAKIGGTKHIPVESLRMKLIREGMEDYEYLVLASKKDPAKAKAIADGLFPRSFESAKPAKALEDARHALFLLLDDPTVPGDGGVPDGGASDAGPAPDGAVGDGAVDDAGGSAAGADATDGGCGCRTPKTTASTATGLLAVALALGLSAARRRR